MRLPGFLICLFVSGVSHAQIDMSVKSTPGDKDTRLRINVDNTGHLTVILDDATIRQLAFTGETSSGSTGITVLTDTASFASATNSWYWYDKSLWQKKADTVSVSSNAYGALNINGAGRTHYDRLFSGFALASWWGITPDNPDISQALQRAMNGCGGLLQIPDGAYTQKKIAWMPRDLVIRGNPDSPERVVINIVGDSTETSMAAWWDYNKRNIDMENVTITGITFNQNSSRTTTSSYGPISFDGSNIRNIKVTRCRMINSSSTAYCNGIFFKVNANKELKSVLVEDCYTNKCRMGVELLNQDHPNNDQVVGSDITIRRNRFENSDYNLSVAGNFSHIVIADNDLGSATSYGAEIAGPGYHLIFRDNRFYGTHNVLFVTNWSAATDYPLNDGMLITGNRTMGFCPGRFQFHGNGRFQMSNNHLWMSGGVEIADGALDALVSTNHIVITGEHPYSTDGNIFYLGNVSGVRILNNYLERNNTNKATPLIRAYGSSSTRHLIAYNVLVKNGGSWISGDGGASYTFGTNYDGNNVLIQTP